MRKVLVIVIVAACVGAAGFMVYGRSNSGADTAPANAPVTVDGKPGVFVAAAGEGRAGGQGTPQGWKGLRTEHS